MSFNEAVSFYGCMMSVRHGAMVEYYWQRKMELLLEKPVPLLLCPPKMPHELTWHRTWNPVVAGPRLTQGTDPGNVQNIAAVSSAVEGRN